jgi:hypothetical protein
MKHGFKRMCIVYETFIVMVCFQSCILYYKCRYTRCNLFLCLSMKHEGGKCQNQANQQNIPNNPSIISLASDEVMMYARNSSDNNILSD